MACREMPCPRGKRWSHFGQITVSSAPTMMLRSMPWWLFILGRSMSAPVDAAVPVPHGHHRAVAAEHGVQALEPGDFLAGRGIGVAREPPARHLVEVDRDRAVVVVRFATVVEQAGER